MEQYQPVDGDPFTGASLQPVNGDPFAEATGGVSMSQGDYASAGQKLGSALSQTWPARMAVGAYDAMMAPGDYMQGKISTEEAERQAFNAAGLVMSGGVLSGVERAAGEAILGSGPIKAIKTVPVEGDPFQPITAYHGSPHDFEQFDISKIGTGEGAQAYGHGLYFADNEAVAKGYRESTSGFRVRDPQGNELADVTQDYPRDLSPEATGLRFAARTLRDNSGDLNQTIADLRQDVLNESPSTSAGRMRQHALDAATAWQQGGGATVHPEGKMYQVQINANPDHFLDWDKPLSEQHPVVQQGLEKVIGPLDADPRLLSKDGGQAHWIASVNRNGDSAAASQALRQAGIPGIKYLDAGSRGSGTGTSNYVVFNHDIIDIIKKYGIGGLGIGTAAGIKHFQTQPVNNDPYSNQNPGGVI